MNYQVFLSYRRDGGEAMAQLLHNSLVERGYKVFYDIESLKSGPFNTKLYERIEECDDFILILPPNALDRCVFDEDWVRCEIHHALKCGKNIIPVVMRGFVFPDDLPNDICPIINLQRIEFENMQYYEARVDRIMDMLHSKPSSLPNGHRPSLISKIVSFGSNSVDTIFPTDTYYSDVVDSEKFSVINFNLTVARIESLSSIRCGMTIYDSKDNEVYEEVKDVEWPSKNNKVSFAWKLRYKKMPMVAPGKYRAEFWVEDSGVYRYEFKIVLGSLEKIKEKKGITDEDLEDNDNGPVSDVDKKLSRPRGWFLNLVYSIFAFLALVFFQAEAPILAIIFAALTVLFFSKMLRYTKKYVIDNTFVVIALLTVGNYIYGIYLFLGSISCLINYRKWKSVSNQIKRSSKPTGTSDYTEAPRE